MSQQVNREIQYPEAMSRLHMLHNLVRNSMQTRRKTQGLTDCDYSFLHSLNIFWTAYYVTGTVDTGEKMVSKQSFLMGVTVPAWGGGVYNGKALGGAGEYTVL